jgi:hypothetical protein
MRTVRVPSKTQVSPGPAHSSQDSPADVRATLVDDSAPLLPSLSRPPHPASKTTSVVASRVWKRGVSPIDAQFWLGTVDRNDLRMFMRSSQKFKRQAA